MLVSQLAQLSNPATGGGVHTNAADARPNSESYLPTMAMVARILDAEVGAAHVISAFDTIGKSVECVAWASPTTRRSYIVAASVVSGCSSCVGAWTLLRHLVGLLTTMASMLVGAVFCDVLAVTCHYTVHCVFPYVWISVQCLGRVHCGQHC